MSAQLPYGAGIEILGTGSQVPDRVVTNDDIVALGVETSDEWIQTRTGIQERRFAGPDEATSHLAAGAARKALADAGVSPSEVSAIFVATCTPDMLFPSTACFVQEQIGAKNAFCLDLNAACSGFVYGMEVVRGYLSGQPDKKVLLIGAEKLSTLINWDDRSTCVLFGDGAGAAVLSGGGEGRGIFAADLSADGSLNELLMIPGGGSRNPITEETLGAQTISMAGREVFRHAVTKMSAAVEDLIASAGLEPDDIALVIPHQANYRIISAIQEKLSLPDEKMMINVERYGNTSAATIPLAMDEAARAGRLNSGDLVLLVAFGAGFTWGTCIFQWTKQTDSSEKA